MSQTSDETGMAPRLRRIRGGAIVPPPPRNARRTRRGADAGPTRLTLEAARSASRFAIDLDGAFAFALIVPLLFIAQLTTLGAAAFAAIAALYLMLRRRRLGEALGPRAFLFVIPVLAILSVVWSEAPGDSLRYALEYTLTIAAGLLLASARRQTSVLHGLMLAFAVYIGFAVTLGRSVGVGVGAGGEAFSGLTASKNLLADIASTGLLISAGSGMAAIRDRRWIWLTLPTLAIALELYAVIAARSAGALLGLGLGLAALTALAPLLVTGRVLRAWFTGAVGLLLLTAGLTYRTLTVALISLGANLFDKDPTLTGRTYLWYRAADLIHEKPLLGAGYYAFWRQDNLDAEGLWRYFGINSRGGFTFHNTLVDMLVTLGWIGAVVIVIVVLVCVFALIRRFVTQPSLTLVVWISLLLYQLVRTPIETIGLAPFYFSTLLMFAALGAAFRRLRPAPSQQPAPIYRPAPIELNVRIVRGDAAGRPGPAGWGQDRRPLSIPGPSG